MKIQKIFSQLLIAIICNSIIIFSAQANCPTITEIIKAFNKNDTAPDGWQFSAYQGKVITKDFIFHKAIWHLNSTSNMDDDGNITCEYTNSTEHNPGYIILDSAFPTTMPKGKEWHQINDGVKTTICKGLGNPANCRF